MSRQRPQYPPSWAETVAAVRERAGGQCECLGECGLHKTTPGPRRCSERNGQPATWAKGKVVLTTAHLNYPGGPCSCRPLCDRLDHLRHMCNRCHLRMDVALHVANSRKTRRARKGQELFPGGAS